MIAAWLNDEAQVKKVGQLSLKISSSIEHENWRMYHEINTGYIRDHFHESKFLVRHVFMAHVPFPSCLHLSDHSNRFLDMSISIHAYIHEYIHAHITINVA
jgi:hypothetical protein